MSEPTTYPADWETKAAFMRARCLTSAKWDVSGALTEAVAGPDTTPATDADRETQPSISPLERERRERLARRDLVARSSGGPVLRLDAED